VRRAAADLLARLPGSAFASAVDAAARPLLATTGRLRPGLAVTLPPLEDPRGLALESLAGKPPTGYGERAWRLRFLLGYVRPARWVEWLGMDERDLVARSVRADEAVQVLDGWWIATTRFGDVAWATALLTEPRVAAAIGAQPRPLVLALDPADRAVVVARVAGSLDPATFASVAASLPPPWPPAVASAALRALGPRGDGEWPDPAYYELVRAAARGLPPDRAEELVEAASHQDRIRPSLDDAIDVVRLRARIHQAFADLPPIAATETRR